MHQVAADAPRTPRAAGLRRWLPWVVVGVVVVAAAVYGVRRFGHSKSVATTPSFATATVSEGSVAVTVSGSGSIQAVSTETVSPLQSGMVNSVEVGVGQTVKANQVLLTLTDTQGLAQQVASAQATLAQAEQQLQTLKDPAAAVDPRSVAQAQLKVQQAQIALQQAELTQSRDAANAAAAAAVTSPVAGTVQSVAVVAGQQVNGGAIIATVLPSGAPAVSVPVPEEDLPYLPVGSTATVTIPSLAGVYTGTVTAVATSPVSGQQVTVTSGGATARSASAQTQSQQLYALTLSLSPALQGAPQDASATVVFTPKGNPPAAFGWTDAGSVAYPSPVNVTAGQSGTVGNPPALGADVTAGQTLTTVSNTTAQTTAQQDAITVQQDKISLQQAQLSLSQAQNPNPSTAAALAAQQAVVASDQVALQQKQAALAELTVRAPTAGTVTAVSVAPGQSVGSGTSAVTLQVNGGLEAVVPIDELDVAKIKVGQPAQIDVNALPGVTFTGSVASVAPSAQAQNGVSTYPVTVKLNNQKNLLPGMSATVLIQVASASGLRVPSGAVTVTSGTQGVVRILQNGQPLTMPVTVGLSGGGFTQIVSGLQPGQAVITGRAFAAAARSKSTTAAAGGRPGGALGGPGGFGAFARVGG